MQARYFLADCKRAVLAIGIVLGAGAVAAPAMGANAMDPDAEKVLRSMAAFMGGLGAFSANAEVDNEVIDLSGQKLLLTSTASVLAERPGKLRMTRHGTFANIELIFDGKVVTIHGKKLNAYAQYASFGTIDDAIRTLSFETGFDAPGADLFLADPYPGLMTEVTSGRHLGMANVGGVESHHLAFRGPRVDWQIWIQDGANPLPMKYVITSKWVAGAPQYSVRFRNWKTNPKIDAARFEFEVPSGARELKTLSINEVGEIAAGGAR